MTEQAAFDLEQWLPAGRDPASYAVELLRSTHLPEVRAAERWLLGHPHLSGPALAAALETPSAQAAAVLLGEMGASEYVPDLVAAHARGGLGLQSAVERSLRAMDVPEATQALESLGL